jgi:hypothetical protein
MSEVSDIAAFGDALRRAFSYFEREESLIRQQYVYEATADDKANLHADGEALLERATRRFLIDGILRGLDWNPDNPSQVAEEARSWDQNGERLYFDYLGIKPGTRTPVILVEAKGYDIKPPRLPREPPPDARGMAELVSEALGDLKSGRKDRAIVAEWAEWLRDLYIYVSSLDSICQASLQRVVTTAGRWWIVFDEPVAVFIKPGAPNVGLIHCFISLEDIVERHRHLFILLHRQRLVDTLSLTMPVAEALTIIAPETISHIFRGVVVVTRESGGRRRSYPTRSIWPCVIAISAGRPFAVTDYEAQAVEEPLVEDTSDDTDFVEFLDKLSARGAAFETRLLQRLGRHDLCPLALSDFPGFPDGIGTREGGLRDVKPIPGSTAATRAINTHRNRALLAHTGEPGRLPEYVVATGETWFYKAARPWGAECSFHAWPKARTAGVAAPQPQVGQSTTSFTQSDECRHCAHEELRGMRELRCHVDVIEAHLCCRSCIFHDICWTDDLLRLPCRTDKK